MPISSAQASRNQLQRYLEQLYSNSGAMRLLISPQNTKNMMTNYAASQDANYQGQVPISRNINSIVPKNTVPTGPGYNRPHVNVQDKLRAALEGSWRAQGNAPYTSPSLPTSTTNMRELGGIPQPVGLSHMPPGGYPHSGTSPTGQIGTPNQTIINLERARDLIEKNAAKPGFGSPGKTSLQLDPNLNGTNVDPLNAIEDELRRLAGQEDIPGQWISPYSQEYLNQLGNRLGQAGSEAQQQFQGAIGDVVNNYAQGNQYRDITNAALANELQGAGGNIGISYGASQQGQQAASDAAYLSQVSGQNQATDTSFMSKMGELANFYGGNLASQAREGLLTPKQYIGPQSGISAGEGLLADFLQNKYNRELDTRDMLAKLAADAAKSSSSSTDSNGIPQIAMTADETQVSENPDFVQAFGKLPEGTVKDLIRQYYNAGDSTGSALSKAQAAMNTAISTGPSAPLGRTGILPRGASTLDANGQLQGGLDLEQVYKRNQDQQSQQWKAVLDFLTRYDPKWNGVTTKRELGTKSTTKYDTSKS